MVNYTDIDTGTTLEGRNAIAHLWHMGVTSDECSTSSCYSTNYWPHLAMTRSEMAKFMTSALDHTNARPRGVTIQAALNDTTGETPVTWAGATSPTLSASYRADDFTWSADVPIDVFYYQFSTTTGEVDFTSTGACSTGTGGPVAAINAQTKCNIDTNDQTTDAYGNTRPAVGPVPAGKTWHIYAWTAPSGTSYDNDIHLAGSSKLDVMAS